MTINKYENGPLPKKKSSYRALLAAMGLNSLLLSILVHVVFGVVATLLIVERFQTRQVNFQASTAPQNDEIEHKVEVAKRSNVESAPPDLKRITTTSISPISLPDVPEMSQTSEVLPTAMSGVDGVMGQGMGAVGSGGGGLGNGNSFGSSLTDGATPALVGTFYDLKQTNEDPPKPTNISRPDWRTVMVSLIAQDMHESVLSKYFKSPDQRSTSGFSIPEQASENAPKAFGLEGKVKPNLWCIVYHAVVVAPSAGRYRFVGFGDDMLVIKKDGTYVFDGGWQFMTNREDLHHTYPFVWTSSLGSSCLLRQGTWFNVDQGQSVNLDIAIGDWGGQTGFFLFLEKEGETYDKLPDGTPKLPLFQVGAKLPVPTGTDTPPASDSPEIWTPQDGSIVPSI